MDKNKTSRDAFALMDSASNKKVWVIAYILWLFLGVLGAHRLYLEKTGSATVMFVVGLVSSIMLSASLFAASDLTIIFLPFGGVGVSIIAIWWVFDMFLTGEMVRKHNRNLAEKIKQEMNKE